MGRAIGRIRQGRKRPEFSGWTAYGLQACIGEIGARALSKDVY